MAIVVARRATTNGEDIPPSWRSLTTKTVYTTNEDERVGEESSRAATATRKTILCHQNDDDEEKTRTMPHGKINIQRKSLGAHKVTDLSILFTVVSTAGFLYAI